MSVPAGGEAGGSSFFDGIPPGEVAELLERLETRRFPAGTAIVEEGDFTRQVYVVESGSADVFVRNGAGDGRRVGRVLSGTTVGEMSLFTGEPASATVRAHDDVVVRVLSEAEFERLAEVHPQIYRTLGAALAGRLARTNQLAARGSSGEVTIARGGPDAAYALACSLAWHTRAPAVALVTGEVPHLEGEPPPAGRPERRAYLLHDTSGSASGLAARVADLSVSFDHVVVAGADAISGGVEVDLPEIELTEEFRHACRGGLLPAATSGSTFARIARKRAGLTVGLALGAGSVRGFAHCGVLRGLARVGLEVDYVCGTSIGSSVAASHAYGWPPDEIKRLLKGAGKTLFRPTLPTRGFMSSKQFGRYLRQHFVEPERIEDLPMPLGIVTADISTGREVVFRRGAVWRAVLASCSIPGIYPAQRMGPYTLVDGGVVNSVPVSVAAEMGAGTVIAVRLLGPLHGPEFDAEAEESAGKSPSAFSAIMRAIDMMQSRTTQEGGAATITITPELGDVPASGLKSFADGEQFAEAGEAAFEAALPRIASALPWIGT